MGYIPKMQASISYTKIFLRGTSRIFFNISLQKFHLQEKSWSVSQKMKIAIILWILLNTKSLRLDS